MKEWEGSTRGEQKKLFMAFLAEEHGSSVVSAFNDTDTDPN